MKTYYDDVQNLMKSYYDYFVPSDFTLTINITTSQQAPNSAPCEPQILGLDFLVALLFQLRCFICHGLMPWSKGDGPWMIAANLLGIAHMYLPSGYVKIAIENGHL